MSDHLDQISITVQKAANGQDYVQIMSSSAAPVNIVLIADSIVLEDNR